MTLYSPMQRSLSTLIRSAMLLLAMLILTACKEESQPFAVASAAGPVLQVLKDPSCACCEGWVEHVSERGFIAQISHPQDLNGEKLRLGIAPQYQSCHTAISEQGYVFEGHIPAKVMTRFLEESPNDAIGLAVPGMPLGSPGMEIGDQFTPYDVLVLRSDGSAQIYAHIGTKDEQY